MFLDQNRIKEKKRKWRKIDEKLKWKKNCIKIPIAFLSTTLDNGKSIKEKLELKKKGKKLSRKEEKIRKWK